MSLKFVVALSLLAVAVFAQCTCQDGTCCSMQDGQLGCCPYPYAVCCSNKKSCCPQGYICDIQNEECIRSNIFAQLLVARVPTPEPVVDGTCSCPSDNTCCNIDTGVGCCPYSNAVCCSDQQSCCPQGYTCDIQARQCLKTATFPKMITLKHSEQNEADSCGCPDGDTCCSDTDGGCCPYANAVCCSDGKHCCPQGYTCNLSHMTCDRANKLKAFVLH